MTSSQTQSVGLRDIVADSARTASAPTRTQPIEPLLRHQESQDLLSRHEDLHSDSEVLRDRVLMQILEHLQRIEAAMTSLVEQRVPKEWYSVREAGSILGLARFTLSEHARLGRIRAQKRRCGRGATGEWAISMEELIRVQNEGLMPIGTFAAENSPHGSRSFPSGQTARHSR